MKCIVIDDEALSREILSVMIHKIPSLDLVGEFSNAFDAMKFLNRNSVDLIFLDIHMPQFNGFDLIETIRNVPQIILVTTDQNLAIDAFNYDSIADYLVKPIEFDRFQRSIDRVLKKRDGILHANPTPGNRGKEFYVNINSRLIKIEIDKINSIEVNGDYVRIRMEDKEYVVHTSLKKIAEKLPEGTFLRIHRSHIINIDKIVDIQDNSVLIGKNVIPISKRNRVELFKLLNLL